MTGSINLENIEILNCGTIDTDRACVKLQIINDELKPSKVTGCAIHHGLAYGLYAKTSAYFEIHNNVFHGFLENGIMFEFAHHFNFTNNVISMVGIRPGVLSASPPSTQAFNFQSLPAASLIKEIRITDNLMYGYEEVGWVTLTGKC